jgi:hypothetical protein
MKTIKAFFQNIDLDGSETIEISELTSAITR